MTYTVLDCCQLQVSFLRQCRQNFKLIYLRVLLKMSQWCVNSLKLLTEDYYPIVMNIITVTIDYMQVCPNYKTSCVFSLRVKKRLLVPQFNYQLCLQLSSPVRIRNLEGPVIVLLQGLFSFFAGLFSSFSLSFSDLKGLTRSKRSFLFSSFFQQTKGSSTCRV